MTAPRVELARQLLENSDLSIDHVATGPVWRANSLRQHLHATIGVSPAAYRRTFYAGSTLIQRFDRCNRVP
jgi:transcriptional regulator GlxA family with amidase domain